MHWLTKTVILLGIACLACSAQAQEKEKTAESTIQAWVATFNDNDPEKQAAFYVQSKSTEAIVSAGVHHHGYKEIKKAYQDDQEQLRYYDSQAKELSVHTIGQMAIITFEHHFKLHILEDDSRWQIQIRTSSVLHNKNGKWKIVHEHSSDIRGTERMTEIKKAREEL